MVGVVGGVSLPGIHLLVGVRFPGRGGWAGGLSACGEGGVVDLVADDAVDGGHQERGHGAFVVDDLFGRVGRVGGEVGELGGDELLVRRQIQGSSIASTKPVPPKFGSERAIDVPSDLTAALSAHIKDTRISDPGEYLFRTPLGHLYQRNNAGEEWRKIRTRVGLPDTVTLHTLRHTYASNLIAAGCDVVTVQRALGHSTPSITLNVYGHLWPTAGDRTRAAAASFMESVARFADSPRTQNRKPLVGR